MEIVLKLLRNFKKKKMNQLVWVADTFFIDCVRSNVGFKFVSKCNNFYTLNLLFWFQNLIWVEFKLWKSIETSKINSIWSFSHFLGINFQSSPQKYKIHLKVSQALSKFAYSKLFFSPTIVLKRFTKDFGGIIFCFIFIR